MLTSGVRDLDDIIIKVTSTTICSSNLSLCDGYQPTTESGDILGRENLGAVVEFDGGSTNPPLRVLKP